jgi:hypothetical protein
MATVPQKVILKTAFLILDPPVFAAVAPRMIKKNKAEVYNAISIFSSSKKSVTKKGKAPPTVKAAPEAKAACMGFA